MIQLCKWAVFNIGMPASNTPKMRPTRTRVPASTPATPMPIAEHRGGEVGRAKGECYQQESEHASYVTQRRCLGGFPGHDRRKHAAGHPWTI